MAKNLKMGDAAVNAEANALAALCNGGFLRLYDGAQPASCDTAVSTQVLLAELTFGNPAFGAAAAGVITANAITADAAANATGTATWFRVVKSDGTALWDGTIGTAGCDLTINSTAIQIGAQVAVTGAFTHTVTK